MNGRYLALFHILVIHLYCILWACRSVTDWKTKAKVKNLIHSTAHWRDMALHQTAPKSSALQIKWLQYKERAAPLISSPLTFWSKGWYQFPRAWLRVSFESFCVQARELSHRSLPPDGPCSVVFQSWLPSSMLSLQPNQLYPGALFISFLSEGAALKRGFLRACSGAPPEERDQIYWWRPLARCLILLTKHHLSL